MSATVWTGPQDLGPGVLGAVTLESGESVAITLPGPGLIGFRTDEGEATLPLSVAREIAAFVVTATGDDDELVATLTRLRQAFVIGGAQ